MFELMLVLMKEKIRLLELMKEMPKDQQENIRARIGGIDFAISSIDLMGGI